MRFRLSVLGTKIFDTVVDGYIASSIIMGVLERYILCIYKHVC